MDINTKQGSKVIFLNENGLDCHLETAREAGLKKDTEYIVERMSVGQSRSTVSLKGFSEEFNTVMFENVGGYETRNWFMEEYGSRLNS